MAAGKKQKKGTGTTTQKKTAPAKSTKKTGKAK
jgi:hypothetical protein